MKRNQLVLPIVLAAFHVLHAQTGRTEHIVGLDSGGVRVAATLNDVSFLAGAWTGEGFGGKFEEVWTPPAAGSMVGLFKLMHSGAPTIYEIQTITEEEGTLVWKVKHFNSDFTAWEDKAEFVSFPLVKVEEGAAYFDGLTLVRDGDNLIVYLATSEKGATREEELVYRPLNLEAETTR